MIFRGIYRCFLKKVLDFVIAMVSLVILSPVFIAITIILFFCNSGSPFFIQARPGRNERIFKMIKFRTMNNKRNEYGMLLPDDQRLTAIGKFLRETSLDEFPQLINVLRNEMSIIGPRPLLEEYLPFYNDFQKRRHEVLPGITGWAQVNGRNAITWEKKFELDVWYIDNLSFYLDLKILWMTIIKGLKREGIGLAGTKTGSVTLEPFKGTK